jgi:hypothetical protein
MIQEFVNAFMEHKTEIRDILKKTHPENYQDIVKIVIGFMPEVNYNQPNPELIHEIDDGDYQGTLLYIIAAKGYQPDTYWYVYVNYGSCSGCDTLQAISRYSSESPTNEQADDYTKLALDIVTGLKLME